MDNKNDSQRFLLTEEPLSPEALMTLLEDEKNGAVVTFTGYVRNKKNNKTVVALDFEAYEPMAILELEKIESEVKLTWPEVNIALHHRLGRVDAKEVPVVAGAASPHRKEAFEACAYLMNRLKESVPIWKKEIFEDGEIWVTPTP